MPKDLINNFLQSRKISLKARGKFVDIDYLQTLGLNKLVTELLILEYGYLLPALKGLTWELCEVDISSLKLNERHMKSGVDPKIVESYLEVSELEINALVVKSPSNVFHLVDGYHRVSALKKKGIKSVVTICGKA